MVFGMLLSLIGLVGMVWVIYDVIMHQKKMDRTNKVLWILGAVFFSIIVAIVYYFVVKKK